MPPVMVWEGQGISLDDHGNLAVANKRIKSATGSWSCYHGLFGGFAVDGKHGGNQFRAWPG